MTMCFDCKSRNIQSRPHGELECHCKFDGHWYNPYRPRTFYNRDCENWEKGEDDERDQDKRDNR